VIRCVANKAELRATVATARCEGRTVGLVPTMGALHEGHLSLVRAACERSDLVIVSIFVNPTQFAPGEDFERYPRRLDADLELLGAEGVGLVFAPESATMYPEGPQVTVNPGRLARRWEGEVRRSHFEGVATVVAKLFGIVTPDTAFFGEKDFQQLAIVKRLALDLELAVDIVGCPILRDADGLALSSRNAYLSAEQRRAGLGLSAALAAAREALAAGEISGAALEVRMRAAAAHSGDALVLDYAAVVDPVTLEPLPALNRAARALIAGRLGSTRLIDNCALVPLAGGIA
jgi:pantoate--beta-alanine ligase